VYYICYNLGSMRLRKQLNPEKARENVAHV